MAKIITMPKFGLTMETGMVAAWLKKPGDQVQKGEPLAEIETDKITSEFESPESGYLLQVIVEEGREAKVKEPICVIGEKGETVDLAAARGQSGPPAQLREGAGSPAAQTTRAAEKSAAAGATIRKREGPSISPRARKLMAEKGIDPAVFQSLKKERITESDVQESLSQLSPPVAPSLLPAKGGERQELTGIRKRIAGRMSLSKRTIPHFYVKVAVDASAMTRLRQSLPFKPAYNDMIVKASAMALAEFPEVNVSLAENAVMKRNRCNIGLAVAPDKGLIVPVVRSAESKSLEEISTVTADLITRARASKLTPDDVTGGTFTISSLGVCPIEDFTAIINPPESAILAVGRILDQPVVVNGQIAVRPVMKLTLSVDHRIIDGMLAAQFLSRIKELLETEQSLVA